MGYKVNYTVVGLFVVALSISLIAIFLWLSTFRHDKTYNTYLVYMKEDVSGLTAESLVRFNGVPVGFVKSIELDPRNPQLVKLVLEIEEGTPITTSTVATLRVQGITGVLNVTLTASTTDAPLLRARPGEKYPIIPSKPSLFVQLSEVLPEVTKNMKNIGDSIGKVLDDRNRRAIAQTLQNLQIFTSALSANAKHLESSIHSLDKTLKNTATASQNFPQIVKEMQQTLVTVNKASHKFGDATVSFDSTMKEAQLAINSFTVQLLPEAQQALSNLNGFASNLQQFSFELERNPTVLIRGKVLPAPGPGENK